MVFIDAQVYGCMEDISDSGKYKFNYLHQLYYVIVNYAIIFNYTVPIIIVGCEALFYVSASRLAELQAIILNFPHPDTKTV